MIRLHADAIEARLKSDQVLATCTFEGVVTDRPARYISYFLQMKRTATRFASGQVSWAGSVILHSVGGTIEQAELVQEHGVEQLTGHVLAVEGRRCRPLSHEVSRFPVLDQDVTPPLWLIVDQFDFISEPA